MLFQAIPIIACIKGRAIPAYIILLSTQFPLAAVISLSLTVGLLGKD